MAHNVSHNNCTEVLHKLYFFANYTSADSITKNAFDLWEWLLVVVVNKSIDVKQANATLLAHSKRNAVHN